MSVFANVCDLATAGVVAVQERLPSRERVENALLRAAEKASRVTADGLAAASALAADAAADAAVYLGPAAARMQRAAATVRNVARNAADDASAAAGEALQRAMQPPSDTEDHAYHL